MSATPPGDAQIPAKAVAAGGTDLSEPTAALLRKLGMLPLENEKPADFATAFTGTPDSVAVIEAGATALSKGWAAGMGATVVAGWGSVVKWYPSQGAGIQETVIWAAAIGTAALAIGIAYIVGSDVRGRAAATVATLEARSSMAQTMIRASIELYESDPAKPTAQVFPVSPAATVKWKAKLGADEGGWSAAAMRIAGDEVEYWLTKGSEKAWVTSGEVVFP